MHSRAKGQPYSLFRSYYNKILRIPLLIFNIIRETSCCAFYGMACGIFKIGMKMLFFKNIKKISPGGSTPIQELSFTV